MTVNRFEQVNHEPEDVVVEVAGIGPVSKSELAAEADELEARAAALRERADQADREESHSGRLVAEGDTGEDEAESADSDADEADEADEAEAHAEEEREEA